MLSLTPARARVLFYKRGPRAVDRTGVKFAKSLLAEFFSRR